MINETSILLILPKDLKKELDLAAKKYKVTRLGLIRFALVDWLMQKKSLEFALKEQRKRTKEERLKGLEKLQKMADKLEQGKLSEKI